MTYREIGISIRSAYSQGWPDDASQLAFRTETRKLFRDAGWQVEEMPLHSGHCDTVRNGKDALYLHPDLFSGVMQEDHIPALQQFLSNAATFHVLGTDLRMECFDLTDEEYRQRLEQQTEQIDNAILEACRTKRRNLFHTGPIAARWTAVCHPPPNGLGTIRAVHCRRLHWRTNRAACCGWALDNSTDPLRSRAADSNRSGA